MISHPKASADECQWGTKQRERERGRKERGQSSLIPREICLDIFLSKMCTNSTPVLNSNNFIHFSHLYNNLVIMLSVGWDGVPHLLPRQCGYRRITWAMKLAVMSSPRAHTHTCFDNRRRVRRPNCRAARPQNTRRRRPATRRLSVYRERSAGSRWSCRGSGHVLTLRCNVQRSCPPRWGWVGREGSQTDGQEVKGHRRVASSLSTAGLRAKLPTVDAEAEGCW